MNIQFLSSRVLRRKRVTWTACISRSKSNTKTQVRKLHNRNTTEEDDVVISGISARLPRSENLEQFRRNLFSKIDMVTSNERWTPGVNEYPKKAGQILNLDKFDAEFFGIHSRLANALDPQIRKGLEVAYEAILDAGINPSTLKGTQTAVYSGIGPFESSEYLHNGVSEKIAMFRTFSVMPSLLANHISYHLDLHGPSLAVNAACSSSLQAFADAVECLRKNDIDSALVMGTQVFLHPQYTKDFMSLQGLSVDGACKSFDAAANGFVRAEAIVGVFLQRKRQAKRAYAVIRGVGVNCNGFNENGMIAPSAKFQAALAQRVCTENGIDPFRVKYVEAHGTGTKLGDPIEIEGLHQAYCCPSEKGNMRNEALLVGSVKSNMGHGENASGLAALCKCIISIQDKKIPGNLHYKNQNPNIPQVVNGSIRIVDEHKDFNSGLLAVNNFGLGGTNAHLILEPNWASPPKETIKELYFDYPQTTCPPLIVPFSGRTKDSVQGPLIILQDESKYGITPEKSNQVRLLQNIFKENIPGHFHRGFTILKGGTMRENLVDIQTLEQIPETRPLWFVFSGMGGHWQGMGKDLINTFPVFEKSIVNSAGILQKACNVSLWRLLNERCTTIFTDVRDAFIAGSAVQMALVDTLYSMGVTPQGYLGHSHGEVGVSYADGCLTAEQVLRMCFVKGTAFMNQESSGKAAMAAVDLSWSQALERCTPGVIEPICFNSSTNVTVAGLGDDVTKFVEVMRKDGIRAKMINSCGQASHSFLNSSMKASLLKDFRELIPSPIKMSSKCLSTCMPSNVDMDNEVNEVKNIISNDRLCSAEYHVFNILNHVLFHQAVVQIPENSVIIEIGPRALFQGVLKDTLGKGCTVLSLMDSRSKVDKINHFLTTLGTLYNSGVNFDLSKLYPAVQLPVPAETTMISSLIQWNHKRSYLVPNYQELASGTPIKINVSTHADSFLLGHKVEGKVIYPGMGYLVEMWKHFSNQIARSNFEEFPIIFENIDFKRAVIIPDTLDITINLKTFKESGKFEISQGADVVVSGEIRSCDSFESEIFNLTSPSFESQNIRHGARPLNSSEVYKKLRLMGYEYEGEFKGIQFLDNEGTWASLNWHGNWTTFLDTMLQSEAASQFGRQTLLPTKIQKIVIEPNIFKKWIQDSQSSDLSQVPLKMYKNLNACQCPGIEIRGCDKTPIQKKGGDFPTIESYKFIPHFDDLSNKNKLTIGSETKLGNLTQLASLIKENCQEREKLKIMEVFSGDRFEPLTPSLDQLLNCKDLVLFTDGPKGVEKHIESIKTTIIDSNDRQGNGILVNHFKESDLIVLTGFKGRIPMIAAENMKPNGFMLFQNSAESMQPNEVQSKYNFCQQLSLISIKNAENGHQLTLFRKKTPNLIQNYETLTMDSKNFEWLPILQRKLTQVNSGQVKNKRIYLTSQSPNSGLVGFAKSLRYEPGGKSIRVIYDPEHQLTLNPENPSKEFQNIIENDLVSTVFNNSKPGIYAHNTIHLILSSKMTSDKSEFISLNIVAPGDLTSLHWQSSSLSLKPIESLIKVKYSSLNFHDLMVATGQVPPIISDEVIESSSIGTEFSGFTYDGSRVMGMSLPGAMGTYVDLEKAICWRVPDHWSMAEAATVPNAYYTALYAFQRGIVKIGESILIHSGTGAVGQAAINVALYHNCDIFTTVGSPEKKKHLLNLFPTLNPQQIGSSRDSNFEAMIREQTDGQGVDVVLNSLAGPLLQASLRCLKKKGRFLEIGKRDAVLNSNLGSSWILSSISVMGIAPPNLNDPLERSEVVTLVQNAIDSGVVRPLERRIFGYRQSEEAFRYMASGKHKGKILLDMEEQREGTKVENQSLRPVTPKTWFSPDKAYLIIGGLGGFGFELANWMIQRGAKKLVLSSRSGVTNGYQESYIRHWKGQGVQVQTPTNDLTNFDEARKLSQEIRGSMGHIGGFFNCAVVLKDGILENQTIQNFRDVSACKIEVTKHFDVLSRPWKDMEYFVCISSAAAGYGNAGQTNYSWANSVMEQICEGRKAQNLPSLAIQFGVIDDVGMVAEKRVGNVNILGSIKNVLPQKIISCLQVLDLALQSNSTLDSCVISSFVQGSEDTLKRGDDADSVQDLTIRVARILGLEKESKINSTSTLGEMGLDSLLIAEVKQLLEDKHGLNVNNASIRKLTFTNLKEIQEGTFKKLATNVDQSDGVFRLNRKPLNLLNPLIKHEVAERPLFLVHGTEGHTDILIKLASKLSHPVYGLQYIDGGESVRSIAQAYLEHVKSIQADGPYNLGGYSSGCVIAHEMGLILEEGGSQVKSIFYMDGYCSFPQLNSRKTKTENHKELHAITHNVLIQDLTGVKVDQNIIKDKLTGKFEEDVETISKDLHNQLPSESLLQIAQHSEKILKRSKLLVAHVPQNKLEGCGILIKANIVTYLAQTLQPMDNNFNKFCASPVKIFRVDGNHTSFLKEPHVTQVAKIIQERLDKSLE